MQKYYFFDPTYHQYLGEAEAAPGDVSGSWIYPINATLTPPPVAPEGTVARWNGVVWQFVSIDEIETKIAAAEAMRLAEKHLPRVLETAKLLARAAAPAMPDATALAVVTALPESFPVWTAGSQYGANEVILHEEKPYRVVQPVTAQSHQPPSSPGMLAVYRPIVLAATGTETDPIAFVNGMDARTGQYFSYKGKLYVCRGDMIPCVWTPGSAGLWQWEFVRDL